MYQFAKFYAICTFFFVYLEIIMHKKMLVSIYLYE